MEGTPHEHEPRVERRWGYRDAGPLEVTYGDTKVRVRAGWIMNLFGYPSAAKVAQRTQLAIQRHDEGSRKASESASKLTSAKVAASEVHSDWWMDSQERMDQLHAEALRMNKPSRLPSVIASRSPSRSPFAELYFPRGY